MNLVVGATGNLGGEICRRLAARGKPIRALVRETSDPKRVHALAELGADLAVGFDLPSGAATLFGDGTAAVSWIAFADVAEVAAACVDEPRAHRRTIELGGPETLSPLEVVQLATEVGGRSIEVALVSREDLERRRHAARGETHESFAALMLDLARGDVVPPHGLDWLPGPATTVRDYLAALPWPAAAPV